MTLVERDQYVEEQKREQRIFKVDNVKADLASQGYDESEIQEITKFRSFEGFSRIGLYGSLLIVVTLMALIAQNYLKGGM